MLAYYDELKTKGRYNCLRSEADQIQDKRLIGS